jgi:hypothetical protein
MRVTLTITLLLSLLAFGYSFVGEARVWKQFSDMRSLLAEWQRSGQALPNDAVDHLDAIVLDMRGEWRVIRGLSLATSIAALVALVLSARKKVT